MPDELKEKKHAFTRRELFTLIDEAIDEYNDWGNDNRMHGTCWDHC